MKDHSNWIGPNTRAVVEAFESAGFSVKALFNSGERATFQALVREGMPEFLSIPCHEAGSYGLMLSHMVLVVKVNRCAILLHRQDLFRLLQKQLSKIEACSGEVFNIGGGKQISTSLLELTDLCRKVTGNQAPIAMETETSPVDIPLYISDYQKAAQTFSWRPERSLEMIVEDFSLAARQRR